VEAILTANPDRQRQASATYPSASVVGSSDELFALNDRLDLVVIASPPDSHYGLARRALDHGLAVVVDKPFVVRSQQGWELIAEARQRGLLLTVFQNRRYDGDFRTVQRLVREGSVGEVRSLESRFEWWKPGEPKAWKAQAGPETGGGILFDLGPHVLDQAVQLFGPLAEVHAELRRYRGGEGGDDEAFVSLEHSGGVQTHATMSSLAPVERPRYTLVGSTGGYVKWGLDVQESQLAHGLRPNSDMYGREAEDRWGRLGLRDSQVSVPTEPGTYGEFYAGVAKALLEGAPPPVDPADAVSIVELIEQIYASTPIRRGESGRR
jgi:scyllo-inositol 2-dehydrogenase (NADP+)